MAANDQTREKKAVADDIRQALQDLFDALCGGRSGRPTEETVMPRLRFLTFTESGPEDDSALSVYWGAEATLQQCISYGGPVLRESVTPEHAAHLLIAHILPDTADYLDFSSDCDSDSLLKQLQKSIDKWHMRRMDSSIPEAKEVLTRAQELTDLLQEKCDGTTTIGQQTAKDLILRALRPESQREEERARIMHSATKQSGAVSGIWLVHAEDLLIAWIQLARLFDTEDRPFRVILVEDQFEAQIYEGRQIVSGEATSPPEPPRLREELGCLSYIFPSIILHTVQATDFRCLYESLKASESAGEMMKSDIQATRQQQFVCRKGKAGERKRNGPAAITLGQADLILLDLHLETGTDGSGAILDLGRPLSGKDLLPLLTNVLPHVPVFVLSKSRDAEDVRECIAGGADAFISKEFTLTVPAAYVRYLKRLGPLLFHLYAKPDLRRQMMGNLRYWSFKRNLLWFGDKCYHMIGHSHEHISNVWQNANAILSPILDHFPNMIGDEEHLFVFAMAIWLHDIGHKGNARYGEAFQIRDVHGLISAELILGSPNPYGIWSGDDPERNQVSPYRSRSFGVGETALELIRERVSALVDDLNSQESMLRSMSMTEELESFRKARTQHLLRLLRAERIALLCIHHQSNSVLHRDDIASVRRSKRIPRDLLVRGSAEETVYALEDICDIAGDHMLLKLAALLRAVDSTDINRTRVGDANEAEAKKNGLARDLSYQFSRLRQLVDVMADQAAMQGGLRHRFTELFYEQVVEDVRREQGVLERTRAAQQVFLTTNAPQLRLDVYNMLVDFIEFICVQDGHFDLHSAMDRPEIVRTKGDPREFSIRYHSNKELTWLESRRIRQKGDGGSLSLKEWLLGSKKTRSQGYVRKDFQELKDKGLGYWFNAGSVRIALRARNAEEDELDFEEDGLDRLPATGKEPSA